MNTKFKAFLCLMLSVALLLANNASAFAYSENRNEIVPQIGPNDCDKESSLSSYYSVKTDFADIVASPQGEYALVTDAGTVYQPVGRLDINLNDEKDIDHFLQNDAVSDSVKEYVKHLADQVRLQKENETVFASFFSPDLLNTRYVEYYTYNGVHLKNERVYVTNITSPYVTIESGSTTYSVANSIASFLLGIVGQSSLVVMFGSTLLALFQATIGSAPISASPNDWSQMRLTYNGATQWTYFEYEQEWVTTYISQSITVTQVAEQQQFVVNGQGTIKVTLQNKYDNVKPSDFDSPWATAYSALFNPVTAWAYYSINGHTWMF